jgi:hypothetical protein
MKIIRLPLIATLGILSITTVQTHASPSGFFSGGEMTLDTFGYWGSRDKDGNSKGAWGPGIGASYFFTDNFGAGVETYNDAFTLPYLLNVNGTFRYPVSISGIVLSPYAFAGVGRQWNHAPQWLGHVAAGIEYPVRPEISVFTDVRGVFPTETKNNAMIRFGFRFKFK